AAGLNAQSADLIRQLEKRWIVIVDRAHRCAKSDQVALLDDHQSCIALGLAPLRLERAQRRAHALRRRRQSYAARDAARREQRDDGRELVAAVAQLLEGLAITLRRLLRGFCQPLRKHPELAVPPDDRQIDESRAGVVFR